MNRICILGMGYIGLPTAVLFSKNGFEVIGVDNNPSVFNSLIQRKLHIEEPGLEERFLQAMQQNKLRISKHPEPADAFIITVPTPFLHDEYGQCNGRSYKKADMSCVISAAEMIVPYLSKGNLVILESTSPPRTTIDLVKPILEKSGLRAGIDFYLCYCPERVLPGQILKELVENSRIIGGINVESSKAGKALYQTIVAGEIFVTDSTTAEMVKLMENTYRDINIAAANEFSRLANCFGVDISEAISLANHHPRVKILNPGIGVGGHCISVDPWFFVECAPNITELIWTARQVNDSQPAFVVEFIKRSLGEINGKHICVLGLAFKADVDDLRESPAIEIVNLLQDNGANIVAYDPYKPDAYIPGIDTTQTLENALEGADALIFLVAHHQFNEFDPFKIASLTHARSVISVFNGLQCNEWEKAGFKMYFLGKPG